MLLARDGGHKVEDQQPHVADDHHVDPAAIVDDLLGLTQVHCKSELHPLTVYCGGPPSSQESSLRYLTTGVKVKVSDWENRQNVSRSPQILENPTK